VGNEMMMKDCRFSLSLAGLLGGACLGTPQHPPQIQGQAPKDPQKATPLCHQTGIDGGMFFLPLRWTERIGDCRANAMVVPTGGLSFKFFTGIK
jgi:hypothetical protein